MSTPSERYWHPGLGYVPAFGTWNEDFSSEPEYISTWLGGNPGRMAMAILTWECRDIVMNIPCICVTRTV